MLYSILIISILSLLISTYALWRLLPRNTRRSATVLLDTSAIMDGRILEVVKSGFVPEQLIIPRFVIAEMQLLADKADHLKRERARYGLQIIQDLQNSRFSEVVISGEDIKSESGVDEKLVKLAKKRGSLLFTTDYNLLKVAEIEGVRVLNINELAQNLRPTRIPGEQTDIKIVGKGQDRTQGVGYLEDGTLVVVDKASSHQGKTLRVEFTRNLQTAAGRMMFAKILSKQAKESTIKAQMESRQSTAKLPKPTDSTRNTNKRRHVSREQSAEDRLLKTIDTASKN